MVIPPAHFDAVYQAMEEDARTEVAVIREIEAGTPFNEIVNRLQPHLAGQPHATASRRAAKQSRSQPRRRILPRRNARHDQTR